MTRYVWDKEKHDWVLPKARKAKGGVMMVMDLPGYLSPTGSGYIDGRYQRREDMVRSGCREVDPSERIDSTPKSAAQVASEVAYMDARRDGPQVSRETMQRLMRG